jgi:hypothetical protein
LAVLEVILPISLVLGSVDVDVDSVSISLVIFPFSFVDVSVSMPELSATIGLVLPPLTFVLCIIWPHLDSRSVTHFIQKVSLIDCSILKRKFFDELEILSSRVLLEVNEVLVLGSE